MREKVYDARYDSYYFTDTGEWAETKCHDPTCEYCIDRPEKAKSILSFWTVENTGWSGGISWFKTGGNEANPLRFKSEAEAVNYAVTKKCQFNDPDMLWRVVHTIIERNEESKITTEKWIMV